MIKVLYLGDPHCRIGNLEESEALLEFVLSSAQVNKVDRIVILGDTQHTHTMIRMEVEHFWLKWFKKLSSEFQTTILVGNHDQNASYAGTKHSLEVFKEIQIDNLTIVDSPFRHGVFAYMPYIHHQDEFVAAANKLSEEGAKVLVCHQTFAGSKYDNGFYAPDGFNPDNLNFDKIISGHVHSRQTFGKVIYPGTATWQTVSDANQEKGLWLFDHNDDGSILKEEHIDTSKVVEPIYEITWKQGDPKPEIPHGRVTVELVGSSTWINQEKVQFKGKTGFKAKFTDKAQFKTRKSGISLQDFINNSFESTFSKEELLEAMKEYELV